LKTLSKNRYEFHSQKRDTTISENRYNTLCHAYEYDISTMFTNTVLTLEKVIWYSWKTDTTLSAMRMDTTFLLSEKRYSFGVLRCDFVVM